MVIYNFVRVKNEKNMKTILQSHFNITNLHAFLKLFQSNAENPWYITNFHLSKAFIVGILHLMCYYLTVVDKRWEFTI